MYLWLKSGGLVCMPTVGKLMVDFHIDFFITLGSIHCLLFSERNLCFYFVSFEMGKYRNENKNSEQCFQIMLFHYF